MTQSLRNPFVLLGLLFVSAVLFSATSVAAAADYYKIRGGIPNSQYYMQLNRSGNQYLFFIGNSVLAGEGLKNKNLRYSYQMRQGFLKHFPEASMNETRHMQPGGSWFALYRVAWGQAVYGQVICSGHLAILDFAADDRGADLDKVATSLEGVLRQIIRYRSTHSRILVYTLTPEMLEAYKAGRTPEYIELSERLADHYDIPSLNLAKYAADKIIDGEISFEDFSADGINPTDAGARIYAEAVAAFVDDLMTAYPIPNKPTRYKLPEPLFPETNDNGRIVAYENPVVERSGQWQVGQPSPIPPFRHILTSQMAGASVRLKFTGSEIGIIDVAADDTPVLEYTIDGGPMQKLAPLADANQPTMRTVSLADGLKRDAEHELMLKVASAGTARLGGFLLNGTVENTYAGMSTLERIDAIYAGMDPVEYEPPAGRFVNIPNAMDKLRNGETLRLVLLGDSIMGNTSASQFDLLLERAYPKCDVIKIAALRGSTGCTYYQEDNRVEDYVLRHKPDLLMIGGISNRGDYEAVRSVIRQVRAKKPDTEVMLITPVFGAMGDDYFRTTSPQIDTTTDNFRRGMQQVAKEENCAFFDMTGPWITYVRDSGKTYGWFQGDRVHANQRGCQIIGRLLLQWFTENP